MASLRRGPLPAVLVALVLMILPAAAQASGAAVIRDCVYHGRITGHYTQKDYAQALAQIDGDTAEYTDCPQLIRAAQLAAAAAGRGGGPGAGGVPGAGSGSGPGGAGGGLVATPSERRALSLAHRAGSGPVDLGGIVVHPGRERASVAGAVSTLPTPLLATVIALLVSGLLAALRPLLARVRARRQL